MNPAPNLPLSDRALQPGETDLLGRGAFVRNLAKILCNAPKGDSVVFALYGKWGEGKTSTLTLLEAELETRKANQESIPVVIRFNPWVFSGREHLFNAFFEDIGNAIGESPDPNRAEAAKRWKRLGAYSHLAGTAVGGINSALGVVGASIPCGEIISGLLKKAGEVTGSAAEIDGNSQVKSLQDLRREMEETLKNLSQPLLVILDDLDRLPPNELVEIFQLLKSTVDLPNVHYLLLCDRENIERNLKKQGLRADYLEKIVQFSAPLPAIPDAVLHELLVTQLQAIFKEFAGNDTRIDEHLWTRIRSSKFPEVFITLRDVKRFVGEFRMTLPVFCGAGYFELNPEHFLKLQALRLFCPSVVELIRIRRSLFMKKPRGLVHLGDEDGKIAKEKTGFAEEEIPAILKKQKASQYLPLVRELLLSFGVVDMSDHELATEQRFLTSRLWFDTYFTIEMPAKYVSVADVKEIRLRLGGTHDALTEIIDQVIRRSGEVALVRCLENQFRDDIVDHGQSLICAILSATPSDDTTNIGSDGPWFPFHDYFARWLRLTPEPEREKKLLDLLSVSRNHTYFSALLYDAKHANHQSAGYLRHLKPLVKVLGKATAKVIEEKSAEGCALLQEGFGYAQDVWVEWGSNSRLKSWIRKVTETDSGLKDYLRALGAYRDAHDGDKCEEYFCLYHHRLSVFPDIREGIRRCSRLLASCEAPREKLLWESALTSFKDQSEYRKGFQFLKKHHPDFLKARFHPLSAGHFTHDIMAVITAENPGGVVQTPQENQRLTRLLADELQQKGISATAFAVGAADGSHLEQSFLISTNLETAVEISRKYNQVAVFMIYRMEFVDIVACGGQGKHRLGLLSQIVVWPSLPQSSPVINQ
jgi:hypothetical protein